MALNWNDIDLSQLVAMITDEVKSRIQYADQKDERVDGTVALFTNFVPSKKACGEFLKQKFGVGIDCALFDGVQFSAPGCFPVTIENEGDRSDLMQKLAGTADIVLVTPKLNLLHRLAAGDDSGFVEQAVLRPLLWGRRVSIVLDFEPPAFKRNTFFEKVADSIAALEQMGVKILSYRPSQEESAAERKALVTEEDVLQAAQEGAERILCERNAIITPLAREKADALHISLDF